MKTSLVFLFLWPLAVWSQKMFPGDANNDGRADHLDILAIGLSFGQEGIPRDTAFLGISWDAKNFTLWPGALPATNVNLGFSDSDGNGFINQADLKAIKQNYDSLQTTAMPQPMPYAPPDTFLITTIPRLIFRFEEDTATVRDTLHLHIFYEHPPDLLPDMAPLGVAFTLEFDEMLVKDSLTRIFFEPSANDLLFAAAATGFADARAVPPGQVEFGAAGKGIPGLPFSRPLGVVQFIVEDVIVRADTFWTNFKIDVAKPLMINIHEQVILFGIVADDVVLFQELTGIAAPAAPFPLRLYPCPIGDVLHLESPDAPLQRVQIFDARGKSVFRQEIPGQTQFQTPARDWPAGWYGVLATARNGRTVFRKVLKR